MSIGALSVFNVANKHTVALIVRRDLDPSLAIGARRDGIIEMIVRFVRKQRWPRPRGFRGSDRGAMTLSPRALLSASLHLSHLARLAAARSRAGGVVVDRDQPRVCAPTSARGAGGASVSALAARRRQERTKIQATWPAGKGGAVREGLRFVRLLLLLALLLATSMANAQWQGAMPKVGILQAWGDAEYVERLAAFVQGLRDLGYIEGRNIHFEVRSAAGNASELQRLASELIDLRVDVIFAATTVAAMAAHAKTRRIPIVIAVASDPVGAGLAASLARPGGNVTGMTTNNLEIVPKRLQLLREIAGQGAVRAAMLYSADDASNLLAVRQAQDAAGRMNIELRPTSVAGANELRSAFASMRAAKTEMLFVAAGVVTDSNAQAIAELAAESRIPAMYGAPEFVEAGGLASYSTDFAENFRAAASYVDRILKGARPADLPIEQSSKYLFVFKPSAARALGLKVHSSLLTRIDRVVE